MGRPRKLVVDKIAAGTYRPSRDGAALCAELGVVTLEEAYALLDYGQKLGGRPAKTTHEHRRDRTYKPSRHAKRADDEDDRLDLQDLIDAVGYSDRRKLLNTIAGVPGFEDPGVRTDGPWFAKFCERTCTLFEGAQFRGLPMVLQPQWRAFFDEALAFGDDGHRIYDTAIAEIPRKNAKSHTCAGAGLALGSPLEGEGAPEIILAAGTAKQAKKVFTPALVFVRRSPLLRAVFTPLLTAISCAENDGSIYRVAADGENQYGEGPYVVIGDELHVWTQERQVNLWQALRSAFGAREDYLTFIISTAGWDGASIFGDMLGYGRNHPRVEQRPDMGAGGFVLRDREAKILIHAYEVAPGTPFDDLAAWKAANPASWRTPDRIAEDLADPMLDEPSKRRQYGDEWTSAQNRWISADKWRDARELGAEPNDPDWIPAGVAAYAGGDAAITHDCTAIGVAARTPDGRVKVRCHVWTVLQHWYPQYAHEFVPGGRLDNEDAEAYVRDVLARRYRVRGFLYDPRYLEDEAKHLSRAGLLVIDVPQASRLMRDVMQTFYKAVQQGRIITDGDPVLPEFRTK